MKKREIITNVGYALIVIDLLLILIFQKNIKFVIFGIAIGGLIYGLITILKKDVKGFITLSLAISLAITGTLYFTKVFNLMKAFTFMICASCFLLMIITLIFFFRKEKILKMKYSIVTEAEVTDLIVNPNTEEKYYQPYYKYELNGNEYYVAYPTFINKDVPNIGDKTKIRVDENDPESIYFEKKPLSKFMDIAMIVFFLVVSFVIMIGQFK